MTIAFLGVRGSGLAPYGVPLEAYRAVRGGHKAVLPAATPRGAGRRPSSPLRGLILSLIAAILDGRR